jgi:UDP-N-acetylmuramoyl-tripeptide--D-alanyl-D-alanine ligase
MNTQELIRLLPLLTDAKVVGKLPSSFKRVHTDSRSLKEGDLFVVLKGDKFDAHDFLKMAKIEGAAAAIAQHGLVEAGLSGVHVPDTRRALGELAHLWRVQFDVPIIAVTGSNGKTTVTQMIACILRSAFKECSVLVTQGNQNNDIGVPLTLLRLSSCHRIAVIEMGMNHPGEIEILGGIAQPTIALVNNAQREHQEFMRSVDAVAKENGTVIASLPQTGTVVIPSDDVYSAYWISIAGSRSVLRFSDTDITADIRLAQMQAPNNGLAISTPQGEIIVQLQTIGAHNIRNALAATACAVAAGIPLAAVEQGLSSFVPVEGRSKLIYLRKVNNDLHIVDDTYNANPDSVRAAIDTILSMPAPRVLVLGDMGEVGEQSLEFHTEVINYACEKNIDTIICIGKEMVKAASYVVTQFSTIKMVSNFDELNTLVQDHTRYGGSLLVKGSRFMKMEQIISFLTAKG